MGDNFITGVWAMALSTIAVFILIAIFSPPSKTKAFVSKYCIEKQVKEACEILGEAYGK